MKKFAAVMLVICLIAALAVAFAACNEKTDGGGGNGGGGNGGGGRGTRYSIQAPSASDVFTVEGLPEGAYEGDTVTFKVTLSSPADSILNYVELYGRNMKYKRLTPSADGSYSFTMPAEPVTLTVDADRYADTAEDNFLKWNADNVTSIEIWKPDSEDDSYFAQWDDAKLVADVTETMYSINEGAEAFALDKNVIPDDAITVEINDRSGGSGYVDNCTVRIDRSKIAPGTTMIVLEAKRGFNDASVLVRTVTVSEPEPIRPVEKWTETVRFQITAVDEENLTFSFEDLDYDASTDAKRFQTFFAPDNPQGHTPVYTIDDDGYVTLTIEYVPGHRYAVTAPYNDGSGNGAEIGFTTSTNGAEYDRVDNELTFDKDGGSVTFTLI